RIRERPGTEMARGVSSETNLNPSRRALGPGRPPVNGHTGGGKHLRSHPLSIEHRRQSASHTHDALPRLQFTALSPHCRQDYTCYQRRFSHDSLPSLQRRKWKGKTATGYGIWFTKEFGGI